ncbi:MAG TPA: glutamine amidotransferase [Rudaea sp.]|nr:glutamine amidotransferase [Rudaea sp.]
MSPRKSETNVLVNGGRKRVLVIQTGTAPSEIRARFGDFGEWFRRGLRLKPEQIRCVRVDCGETLPAPENVAAALVTGSGAMVTQRLEWSERTAAWLLDAAAAQLPMLGVCYGHQLLAHAFGGRVDYNPRGREIGSVDIEMLPAAKDDALFDALPSRFAAQATHLQSVTLPPRDAVVLARSTLESHQIVRYANKVWGVQFHPEFGVAQMRAYLRARAEAITSEAIDVSALLQAVRPSPVSRSVLRRFVRLARS